MTEHLAVDLGQMRAVVDDLNHVADDYDRAIKLASCFPPRADGPWINIVEGWPLLQSEVLEILSDTQKNLTDTAKALNDTADDYEEADRRSADELRRIERNLA